MLKISEIKSNAKERLKIYWGESTAIFAYFASAAAISILLGFLTAELLQICGLAKHSYPAILFEKNISFLMLTAVIIMLLYVFTVPAIFGRCWCYMQTAKGNIAPANCLFSCFSTKGVFLRCLKLKILVDLKKLIVLTPMLVVFILECYFIRSILNSCKSRAVAFLFIMMGILFALSLFLLYRIVTMRYLLVNYLFVSNPDGDIKYIIKKSTMLMKGYEKQITLLYLSFIGWVVLCVIIFPLLLVLPYYHMTMAEAVNQIISERSKKQNNVYTKKQRGKSLVGV
jgi:uncharacterized membrane protein